MMRSNCKTCHCESVSVALEEYKTMTVERILKFCQELRRNAKTLR